MSTLALVCLLQKQDAHPNIVSAVRGVDMERLLLETDSLHLADRPRSINTPNAVFKVAEVIARMRDMTPEEVITQTTRVQHKHSPTRHGE